MEHNKYTIGGFDVLFPAGKKPFPSQFAVISHVLKALNAKENALLESPTGTGKVCCRVSFVRPICEALFTIISRL